MLKQVRPALTVFFLLSALTGIIYPFFITGAAQVLFPEKANGSLIRFKNANVGSELIGQQFVDPKYFWGRLSATPDFPYNTASSSGSNLGPSNPALAEAIKTRVAALQKADPHNTSPIPVDLVTSSGSGLDPHLSPPAALYQLSRVARARSLPEEQVRSLIDRCTEGRQWGFLGEPRVNILKLNHSLDRLREKGA